MSDFKQTLTQYLDGALSQEAFFQAFENRYRESLLGFLLTLTSDHGQVEDIYQEFLIRLLHKVHTHKRNSSFKAWILRVVRNVAMDYLKSTAGKRLPQTEIPPETRFPGPGPKTENIQKEIKKIIMQALDGLPVEYRELIFMKFNTNLTYLEISGITGLPPSTVQSRIEKGVNLLYGVMESLSPEND